MIPIDRIQGVEGLKRICGCLCALLAVSLLIIDLPLKASQPETEQERYGEASESMADVEIVTAENYVPIDPEVSQLMENVAMGASMEQEPSLMAAGDPYWKEENGVRSFYDGYGNLVYGRGTKKIIDVSEHNGKIDWEAVKASGVDGAIIRLGWGYLGEDTYFDYNISECNRLGIPYGLYLYSYAYDANFAYAEAVGTAEMLKDANVNLSYPFYYDIENFTPWNDNGTTRRPPKTIAGYESIISTYITTLSGLDSRLSGKIHVYSYRSYLTGVLNSPKVILPYVSWAAEYGPQLQFTNRYYTGAQGWQYTSSGTVSGVSGRVDISCFSDQFYNKELSTTIPDVLKEKLDAQGLRFQEGYISGFALGSNLSTLAASLSSLGAVTCTNASGNIISSAKVASGQTVSVVIEENGEPMTYTMQVVIYGDVNGDGEIYATDYVRIKNHIMGKSTLTEPYARAADVNKDGHIYATDYVRIKNSIMGKGSIQQ